MNDNCGQSIFTLQHLLLVFTKRAYYQEVNTMWSEYLCNLYSAVSDFFFFFQNTHLGVLFSPYVLNTIKQQQM